MFGIGFSELIVIVVLIIVLMKPEKLPEMAKTIGRLLKEYRKVTDDIRKTVEDIDLNASKPYDTTPQSDDDITKKLTEGGTHTDV